MKNKSILMHVRNKEALNNYKRMLENGAYDDEMPYSKEVAAMIEEFKNNDWNVYLVALEDIDIKKEIFYNVYSISEDNMKDFTIEDINNNISAIIIRNVGSVELNFVMIQEYLNYLIKNYKGKVINNAKAMLRGMTKHYLTEINPEELKEYNVLTIPTKIYSREISFEEICRQYPTDRENYIIKPVTGELSNSLKCLADIDEQFLRWKENKVGGWVVQPIQQEIWNGEYQMSFLNEELIYAQQKQYPKDDSGVPNQKNRKITKYFPDNEEIENMKKVIKYFKNLYEIDIDICRIDFMKNNKGQPILLEFEMVNPGFFIGYMKEHDEAIEHITHAIRMYCEKCIN